MRRAARVDKNQALIVERFRAWGCSVTPLHAVGQGVPDLCIGVAGVNLLVEVKSKSGRLTPAQIDYHRDWRGQICIVRTVEEVDALVQDVRAEQAASSPRYKDEE